MLVQRRLPWRVMLLIGLRVSLLAGSWALSAFFLYSYAKLTFLRLPFLPIATIGTAVAFYVGFKNNSAYDRFWEGRKIWGGIVNASRAWAAAVLAYVEPTETSERAQSTRRDLIYRQLAWVNALRLQLRQKSRFMQPDAHHTVKRRLADHADHMRNDWQQEISPYLADDEYQSITAKVNPATHLLSNQGQRLANLLSEKRLDLFHQIALMETINELYTLQGQCERIKNTPFPRQYAEFSRWFVRVFIFLLPFGMLNVFSDQLDAAQTILDEAVVVVPMVFCSCLISWVFVTMEGVGDASEDPFERSMNDVPMNALCRAIERDLRQLLGETELPEPEQPAGIVLY